jgi:hypothetical protein
MGRGIIESGLFRAERYGVEERTSDPSTHVEGDRWIRTDLAPDTDQIATYRFDMGSEVVDFPIYDGGATVDGVEKVRRVRVNGTTGFVPFAESGANYPQWAIQHKGSRLGAHDALTASAIPDDAGVYLDDVADNKLTNRDIYSTTPLDDSVVVPSGSPYGPPVRPEWTTASGSPSATGEELVIPDGSSTTQILSTSTPMTSGTWDLDWQQISAPSSGILRWFPIYEDSNNWIAVENTIGANREVFAKLEGGSFSVLIRNGGAYTGTSNREWMVTHDGDGNWEWFVNGSSVGTYFDAFLPTANEIRIRQELDTSVEADNLRVF